MAIREKEMLERLKNSPQTNIYGEFLYGIAKFAPNDSVVQGYVEVKVLAGDISPLLIVSALLEHKIDFDEPFIKRVILAEIYYWIMKRDIEGKVGK